MKDGNVHVALIRRGVRIPKRELKASLGAVTARTFTNTNPEKGVERLYWQLLQSGLIMNPEKGVERRIIIRIGRGKRIRRIPKRELKGRQHRAR